MSRKGYMNLTRGEPAKYEQVIALMTDDFELWLKQKNEIKTSLVEIFPGMQVAFVIRKLPCTYTDQYGREIQDSNIAFYNGQEQRIERKTGNIMFTVELLKEGGGGEAKLAGRVEVNIGGKLDYGWVGNFEKENYQGFNSRLIFNSRNFVKSSQYSYHSSKAIATGMFLYNPEHKVALKLKFDLYNPGSVRMVEVPRSLRSENTLSSLNKAIMKEVSTTDLTILADSGSKFKVHKNFIFARSPVVRAMVAEGKKDEITIAGANDKTIGSMIEFIYTGELSGEDFDLQKLIYLADKFNMQELRDLICFKMVAGEFKDDFIPDMLIAAHRNDSQELKNAAMDKIRIKREVLKDQEFVKKLQISDPNILVDLFNQL